MLVYKLSVSKALLYAKHASLKTFSSPNDIEILGQCRQHLAATVIHV